MRIVVAEDMLMWRELFVKTCREHGHRVVGETGSAGEALKLCRELRPEVLLLDIRLEENGNGLEVADRLRDRAATAQIKIVVITSWTLPYFIGRIAQAPVDGYIDKNRNASAAIADALAAVAQDQKWFPAHFQEARRRLRHDPCALLSGREQSVLSLIGCGYSNGEIGRRLGVSPRTAEAHRRNLMFKLGIRDSAKLVAYAIANGFAFASGTAAAESERTVA